MPPGKVAMHSFLGFRRRSFTVAMIPFLLLLAGCLISERDEYSIHLNADGKSGTVTVVKRNIQSDQPDPARQQADFEELVRDWQGDEYLLDKTGQGVYVKDRRLDVEGGVLVWRETSLFSDFRKLFQEAISGDSVRIVVGADETVVRTNGDVVQTRDSTTISWPPSTRDFGLTLQKRNFTAASDFTAKFRLFMQQSKEHRRERQQQNPDSSRDAMLQVR